MPRVRLNNKQYKQKDLAIFIRSKCIQNNIDLCVLAELLGISRQAFNNRINKGLFSYSDLLVLVDELKVTDDELLSLMRLGRKTIC